MNDIKMLVLDIDGTLTNSQKEITKETKRAIHLIQERGHKVMLASGRPTPGMKRYAEELQLEKYGGYLLSFNGGRIINCRTGEIVFQKMFPATLIPQIYRFAKLNDCGILTYYGDKIISGTRLDEYTAIESRINGMPIQEVTNFVEFVDFDVNKLLLTADGDRAEKYVDLLNEKYKDRISVYRSEPFFIEMMPLGVDKAASIDRMLSTVGMTRENIICCGDGYNDVTMIEYAGVGVAMANARDQVKEKADYITKSNDEDGIVQVIDEFIL